VTPLLRWLFDGLIANSTIGNSATRSGVSISSSPKIKIGIVGSGIAGLSAAWLLNRQGCDVTLFEKGPKSGFAVHSCDIAELIPQLDGQLVGDIPSRMFNESLWPSVIELYREAGIEFEPVDQQQTFHVGNEVLLKVTLPYRASSLIGDALKPSFRRLVGSITRFQNTGRAALRSDDLMQKSFGSYMDSLPSEQVPKEFVDGFLLPALTSTVFTCPRSELLQFPAALVLEALNRIASEGSPLMRTVHGSLDASRKLLEGIDSVRFNAEVQQIDQSDESAFVVVDGDKQSFDHVIVATQANHASRLVENVLPRESSLLSKFHYVDVPVVLHTDSNVLPPQRSDWGTFNFDSQFESATCTVWMNRFHKQWPETTDVFHSIFPQADIDPQKVLASVVMQRPVVDFETASLHQELDRYHANSPRIWFSGSYASPGVPLLESGVAASKKVAAGLCLAMSKAI